MAQTLTQMKALLAERGLRPKHRFGQNFLHDHNQLRKIMAAAELAPGDLVLEVGPGTGALTEQLVEAGADVVAVEIDGDLEPILRDRLGERITLHMGNALAGKHELNPQVMARLGDRPFKLIANLPYNVASPLLANLAVDVPMMQMAVVMIQREVADRLTADPGCKDYGPLGIIIQAMCSVEKVATLPPGCFWPPPQVSSAVVKLTRREVALTDDPHRLAALLHQLFSKRRKQLGSILGREMSLPAGIDPQQRAEQLTLDQLVALSRALPIK